MLTISYSAKFKKDYKTVKKRGYDITLLEEVLKLLCTEQPLPQKHRDHALSGNYDGHRECHISPTGFLFTKLKRTSCCSP